MFGFGGAKTLIGLDIGSWSVKAVELERRGEQIGLVAAGRARIESPELAEDTVAQVIESAGIRSKRAVTAVSGRSVIVPPPSWRGRPSCARCERPDPARRSP